MMENKVLIPWKSTEIDGLPPKPGVKNYEQIPCLVIRNGDYQILVWNCEHNCWDDESGDDYECDPLDVDHYIPLSELSNPQP